MERGAMLCRGLVLRKHSESVKKRLFRSKWQYENIIKPEREREAGATPEPLKYAPTYAPTKWLPNGWSPPPEPGTPLPRDNLPFQVRIISTHAQI
jgi:hypothetical protein